MNELALFAGAGLGLLGTHHLLGWRCIGYVEMEKYPCEVLEARIRDGLLSPAPIFQMHTREFIKSGLCEKYRGMVDVITAGFPCQPFSASGKRRGPTDQRNGWPDTIAIIRLVRPKFLLLENVAGLIANPYFGTILGDLAESGYDYIWDCIPASACGANHQRDRLWIAGCRNVSDANIDRRGQWQNQQISAQTMAHSNQQSELQQRDNHKTISENGQTRLEPDRGNNRQCEQSSYSEMANPNSQHVQKQWWRFASEAPHLARFSSWWQIEPDVGRVVNGCPSRVDRLKAIGNGQVPIVVKEFWRLVTKL